MGHGRLSLKPESVKYLAAAGLYLPIWKGCREKMRLKNRFYVAGGTANSTMPQFDFLRRFAAAEAKLQGSKGGVLLRFRETQTCARRASGSGIGTAAIRAFV